MTKIKFCGISRISDIENANELKPDYIGFVFTQKSKRYVSPEKALNLKQLLDPEIKSVGVFVDEKIETIAELFDKGIIDIAQLHGNENNEYIDRLKQLTSKTLIKAFRIKSAQDITDAQKSSSDYVLLDSGAGTGTTFDWKLIKKIERPFFLAGGLGVENVEKSIELFHPFAVDVSSGIEVNGVKDKTKMTAFAAAVRKEDRL